MPTAPKMLPARARRGAHSAPTNLPPQIGRRMSRGAWGGGRRPPAPPPPPPDARGHLRLRLPHDRDEPDARALTHGRTAVYRARIFAPLTFLGYTRHDLLLPRDECRLP